MDADARRSGNAADFGEIIMRDQPARSRSGLVPFDDRSRRQHTGFNSEFTKRVHRIGPEGEAGADLPNLGDLLNHQGFDAHPAKGYGGGKSADTCSDD